MMSLEQLDEVMEYIESTRIRDIVNINGRYFLVSSTFTLDAWYETMVFRCDKRGINVNYREVYVEHHKDYEQMKLRHKYIIENLKELLHGKTI